jgi:cytoskeletal protein RodZ
MRRWRSVCSDSSEEPHWLLEDFVKIRHSLLSIPALVLTTGMMIWGGSLSAQTTTPSDPQAPAQTQPPPDTTPTQTPQTQTPDTQTPSQTPDASSPSTPSTSDTPKSSAQAPAATDVQSFSGTVVKSGNKYVLQEDGGTTYDIDHQDDVAKFEGKRVKVHGTLDPTGKKILVQ